MQNNDSIGKNSMLFYSDDEIDEILGKEQYDKGYAEGINIGRKEAINVAYRNLLLSFSEEDAKAFAMKSFDLTEEELLEIVDHN